MNGAWTLSNNTDALWMLQAMVPYHQKFLVDAVDAVQQGYVSEERLDIAVAHVLQLKRRLGYLSDARLKELGAVGEDSSAYAASVGDDVECTPIHALRDVPEKVRVRERAESLQAAKDGLVLVKNECSALPLHDVGAGDVVAVVGPSANTANNLLGAWSYHWQGPIEEVRQLSPSCCAVCMNAKASEVEDRHYLNQARGVQVPFESCASAMKSVMRELGGAAVSATGVTVSGEEVSDNCLTVAAAASKAIM
jgi:beta-glucosidase-like glycosyl hydrolase